ncbi:MAG: glycosyltransferase family 2 protein, partial [Pseudomonadota bacterium]
PKTKPKALNYALPLCKGEFLVLYDAEDRPSAGQLREAFTKFTSEGPTLACVQAPLHIHNFDQCWLTRLFHIEYLTLFNGILPVLAKWRTPMPLGGTSNHFRADILKKVGAWDPFNVTEDADLGIRLFREGYRCDTITLPTFEEAPSEFDAWLKQRTRWIKGWMQTILVHSRHPFLLVREIGLKNALSFHILLTALVVSALAHPILLFLLFYKIFFGVVNEQVTSDTVIFLMSVFNLVAGYLTYGLLAYIVLNSLRKDECKTSLAGIPIYWLIISIAAWRALVQLYFKPHYWEKTPHSLYNHKFRQNF